ncbi:hypothetical protein AAU57_09365 [Nonlabens sp. YIK11]|uniref:hypothetical protein n=1 Tax=Nonlabens sp. YIK11 TaxID=1453349 RepID=UPI0006DBE38F|nr:hypothetical protein [Nonlabens sp. YIK11]KQC33499.1 hypothetical protein AAU57_09365 [Nonlabens sp. YIK11]
MITNTLYGLISSSKVNLNEKFALLLKAFDQGICPETITSLACTFVISSKNDNQVVISWIKDNVCELVFFEIDNLHRILYLNQFPDDIRNRIANKKAWLSKDFTDFIKYSLNPKHHSILLTSILVLIKEYGLNDNDIKKLTIQMANSGKQYNYMESADLSDKILLRRYPTGGVSEKTALIMPSLLKCLSRKFKIASPFLVAKTLSFTGGTWDKLNCIPGFSFPLPGQESIEKLVQGSVCMTVTKGDYNPSDNNLYQLRSITNTVNSLPLIVSSIASKQIANPVHQLLLDIRYGENTFLKSKKEAVKFFKITKSILENNDINSIAEYTNSEILTGSSIGNYLEVLEAVCVMKNQTSYSSYIFDQNGIDVQRDLVIDFTSTIISSFSNVDKRDVSITCREHFAKGDVFESFKDLLLNHGVSQNTISLIEGDKEFVRGNPLTEYQIKAEKNGTIRSINTRNIGEYVNFFLSAGTNMFSKSSNYYNGVIINKQINQTVKKGDKMATIHSQNKINNIHLTKSFFEIY